MVETLVKPTIEKREKEVSRRPRLGPIANAALWAMALFISVNLILQFTTGSKRHSNDIWSGTGSIDLRLCAAQSPSMHPNVVLLGSSLMMYPFWAADADANPSLPDIFHHHRSHLLEQELKSDNTTPVVLNMSVFGSMASDAYIYVKELLHDEKKPELVVFGIAPRDLYDSDLPSPMSTFTFERMVDLSNFGQYADLYLPTFQNKADFLLSHTFFMYGRRWRLQKETDKIINKLYVKALPDDQPKVETKSQAAGFMLGGTIDERWKSSTEEYSRRYKGVSLERMSLQMRFLKSLLELSRQREIKVLLVNMPLAEDNRRLLPKGFYATYTAELARLAAQEKANYLDLGESTQFVKKDYWDTAHLNHFGGHKLIDCVAKESRRILGKGGNDAVESGATSSVETVGEGNPGLRN
ncbi:MAG: DUF1574 domain-containing protein [Cyanobacteria bacterium]|nr:DUF1574 domain-containing protein [Cyanobacteriota bacterium]